MPALKKTKNQIRRQRAKEKKAVQKNAPVEQLAVAATIASSNPLDYDADTAVSIDGTNNDDRHALAAAGSDLFANDIDIAIHENPAFAAYKSIFSKFDPAAEDQDHSDEPANDQMFYSDDDEMSKNEDKSLNESKQKDEKSTTQKNSKSRKHNKVPVAQLKAECKYPELVEWYDGDAPDPRLAVRIKCAPFVVQVPSNWQSKREYLSLRGGIRKRPYEIPEPIRQTGIMEMRDALNEDTTLLRQQMRERVQPKMGRLDIDYQKLHDAFFKSEFKPRLYKAGAVYYEGKENELDTRQFRPGKISERLREALNMASVSAPPPWVTRMQRHGPPPSYDGLQIPAVTAAASQAGAVSQEAAPNRARWGMMIDDEEDDEDDEGEEEEQEQDEEENEEVENGEIEDESDLALKFENEKDTTPYFHDGPKSGTHSPSLSRPEAVEQLPSKSQRKELFQVLEESAAQHSGFMGHGTAYQMPEGVDDLLAESQLAAERTRKSHN